MAGNAIGTVSQTATFLLATASGSCRLPDLTLGPLDLDLLGLRVHLDTVHVHLTITAQQGSGNLLGAGANLLNGGGGLSAALNQILAAL